MWAVNIIIGVGRPRFAYKEVGGWLRQTRLCITMSMDNADFVADLYPVGTDWYSLGVFLNIETQALYHISEQFGSSGIHRCLCELYKLLVSTKGKCSWSDVADALSTMRNHTLSENIRQKHLVGRYDALFVDSDIAQCML